MAGKSPSPLGLPRPEPDVRAEGTAGPPVPPMAASDPGPPVPPGPATKSQMELTRALYEDLGEVVNRHRPSPETLLMALQLLRLAATAPRRRQMELEE